MTPRKTEDKLKQIRELADTENKEEALTRLATYLKDRNNVVVSKAVKAIAKQQLYQLADDLASVFERFMVDPVKNDPACLVKNAVIDTLYDFDYDKTDVFIRGIRHFQPEPAYGKPIDTAANLRGKCGQALATLNYSDIHFELANLLTDPELPARQSAVDTLAYLGDQESQLLLLMKINSGDPETEVICQCFSAMATVNFQRFFIVIKKYLNAPDLAIATGAALALGESKTDEALQLLTEEYENQIRSSAKKRLILPIALTMKDEAYSYLLEILENGEQSLAHEAYQALQLYTRPAERIEEVERLAATIR